MQYIAFNHPKDGAGEALRADTYRLPVSDF